MPWVHIDDVAALFLFAAANPEAAGAINITAPSPVTNAEFTRTLGRVLHRPAVLPVPAFVLRAVAQGVCRRAAHGSARGPGCRAGAWISVSACGP